MKLYDLVPAWKAFFDGRSLDDKHTDILLSSCLVVCVAFQVLACWNAEFSVEQGEAGNYWEALHYMLYGTGVQNFEWSKEYAIRSPLLVAPLAVLAWPKFLLPLSKLQVLFVLRFSMSLVGSVLLYKFANSLRSRHGNGTSVLTMLLASFNHGIALAMGRLGVDSFTMILHMAVLWHWLDRRIVSLIWLCAITVYLRLNFVVVASCLAVDIFLFHREKKFSSAVSWASYLARHTILAMATVGMMIFLTDSLWYGRLTFSWFNFLHFNIMRQGSDHFGRMSILFYVDKLLLDNNLMLTVGGTIGMLSNKRILHFCLPTLVLLFALSCVAHKEYRFLFSSFPVLAASTANFLERLRCGEVMSDYNAKKKDLDVGNKASEKSASKTSESDKMPQSLPSWKAFKSVLWKFLLSVHIFSGVSLVCLQMVVYSPHAEFSKLSEMKMKQAVSDQRLHSTCLCTFPWCSWLLPEACEVSYFTCIYEDFFPGYTNVTYKRFEGKGASALIDVAPSTGSYTYQEWYNGIHRDDQYMHHEKLRMNRLLKGGKSVGRLRSSPLNEVDHVFFYEISYSPHNRFRKAFTEVLGKEPPPRVAHHLYSDLMLGTYLRSRRFSLAAEARGIAEPGIFNFDPLDRISGLWWRKREEIAKYTIHSYWTREARKLR